MFFFRVSIDAFYNIILDRCANNVSYDFQIMQNKAWHMKDIRYIEFINDYEECVVWLFTIS